LLAAAARCMRRIPGVGTLTAALSVVVTHHRASLAGRSPVVAGGFRAPRKGSVRRRSGEDIVPIGRIPASVHRLTPFVDAVLLPRMARLRVELRQVARDQNAVRVVPGPLPDAIACVDRWLPVARVRAQIGAPCLSDRLAHGSGEA